MNEDEKQRIKNTKCLFFDKLINLLTRADACHYLLDNCCDELKINNYLSGIRGVKKEFYNWLEEFKKSDYYPTNGVNGSTIEGLLEFESLDWTNKDNLKQITDYLLELEGKRD